MRLGVYEITGEVGRGGMGVVFRARAPSGADVAVKILVRAGSRAATRFDRERRLLASLRSEDGFVPLLDAGQTDEGPFLVMPFLPGGTLRDRFRRGPLEVDEAVGLGIALGRAMGRAHAKGIVHRDLKPANILFDGDGHPMIADLGLAKHFSIAASGSVGQLSKTGELRGTFGYMPPEQIRDAKSVAPSADVYSIGAILYEGLTGVLPHDAESPVELAIAALSGKIRPVGDRRDDVPDWLEALIRQCLRSDPRKRPKNGAALAHALRGGESSADESSPRRAASPAIVVGATAVAASLLTAGAVLFLGGTGDQVVVPIPPFPPPPPGPPPGPPDRPPSSLPALPVPAPTPGSPESLGLSSQLGNVRPRAVWGSGAFGHRGGMITSVDLSPDGRSIVSAALSFTAEVWDLETGRRSFALASPHGPRVSDAVYTPDGSRILTIGQTENAPNQVGKLRVWDASSGALLGESDALPNHGFHIAVTADGRRAVATTGKHVHVFDITTDHPEEIHSLPGSAGPLGLVPGDRELVVVGADMLRRFELETGDPLGSIPAPSNDERPLVITPDGRRVLLTVPKPPFDPLLLELETGEVVKRYGPEPDYVRGLDVSADGTRVITASNDGRLRLYDLESATLIREMPGHFGWAFSVRLTPDGRHAISGGNDSTVRLWDLETGEERPFVEGDDGHWGAVSGIAWSEDGTRVLTVGHDGVAAVRDPSTGGRIEGLGGRVERQAALISRTSPALEHLVVASEKGCWTLDLTTGAARPLESQRVIAADISADGRAVLSLLDGSIVEHAPDATRRILRGPHPDQRLHATGVHLVRRGNGESAALAITAGGGVQNFILPEGNAAEPRSLQLGIIPVTSALARATGRLLLGGMNGEVVAYELGELRRLDLGGHRSRIASVTITPDGRRGASIDAAGAIVVWDLEGGRAIDTIIPGRSPVANRPKAISISPDGRTLAVGTWSGQVVLFALPRRVEPR